MTESVATASPLATPGDLGALLSATAAGDGMAFERLYRETSARLFGICLRILPVRGDAEEVLQEVYTTIWRKASRYDASLASPNTWLAMIARNRAIDRLRADAGNRRDIPIDAVGEIVDDEPTPLADAEAQNQRSLIDGCLQELEAKRRTLIRTAFFEGATYEELARRCGSPLGTVKSWIRRGLLQLKACLER